MVLDEAVAEVEATEGFGGGSFVPPSVKQVVLFLLFVGVETATPAKGLREEK